MPITRRNFCKTLAISGVSSMLAACSFAQLGSQVPALGVQRPFVVWTLQNCLDAPIARWRRLNPQIAINRIALAPADIQPRVMAALAGNEAMPDAIVTDSATLGALQRPGVFRQLPEFAPFQNDMAAVGIQQCSDPNGQLFAVPLTVNPYGLWYRSDLLRHAGQVSRPDNVTAAIGDNWDTFVAFCADLYSYTPDIALVADVIDDIFVPMQYQALARDTPNASLGEYYREIVTTTSIMHNRTYAASAPRLSGTWFDLLQRDQIAMVMGGSWLQSALARTVRPDEFPWRLVPPPGGWIAGPGLAIAISEQSNHIDIAWSFALALAHDAELQLSLSDANITIPALRSTYGDGRFQRTEPFAAGQHIGQLWTTAATQMQSQAITPQRNSTHQAVRSLVQIALTNNTPANQILTQIDALATTIK
jgi:cellobiose transport system substrate-binding protein